MRTRIIRPLFLATTFCLVSIAAWSQQAASPSPAEENLTPDQIKNFLKTAKVIKSQEAKKGITHTLRLTMTDGTITHDASFQPVEEHKMMAQLENGKTEMNFTDSYKYNIAAYELAVLVGMDDMVPVYVERKWQGKTGSLSWWLPVRMDEGDRLSRKVEIPPDMTDTWNKQMYKIRVFDQLVYDNDPNLTNVLIGDNWKVWRIDFTRSFRQTKEPRDYKDLTHCDRQLLEKLKTLNADDLAQRTKSYLTKDEVKAVMARRDKIVEYVQKEIAEKGENQVLY